MKAYILVGAPGSGKSTWGKKFVQDNPAVVRLCPDEFRAKFGTGENDQSVSYQAFKATYAGMEYALSLGQDVLIDATNMFPKRRREFTDIAKKWNAKTIAVVFEATKQTLQERVAKRVSEGGRNIPEEILDMMLSKYVRPTDAEFNEVRFESKLLCFKKLLIMAWMPLCSIWNGGKHWNR